MKKEAIKKATAKKVEPKSPVFPTVEQRLKDKCAQLEKLSENYTNLLAEYNGLKNSFSMVKSNYEREKNRLDKVIDTALNNSSKN